MKKYVVRLRNSDGFILDGEVFNAESPFHAFNLYLARCERLGICKCKYDTYSIEEWIFD